MAMNTKTKILDVAEKLFAEQGVRSTSLRNIIAEANVNLASIHYHFGSKEILIREVLVRRIGPINEERIRRLEKIEEDFHKNNPVALETLIRAFLEPVLQYRFREPERGKLVMKLISQFQVDSGKLHEISFELCEELSIRYINAFQSILPQLSQAELVWRFKFMLGATFMIMAHLPICKSSIFAVDASQDLDVILNNLITFVAAGFNAESTERQS